MFFSLETKHNLIVCSIYASLNRHHSVYLVKHWFEIVFNVLNITHVWVLSERAVKREGIQK